MTTGEVHRRDSHVEDVWSYGSEIMAKVTSAFSARQHHDARIEQSTPTFLEFSTLRSITTKTRA